MKIVLTGGGSGGHFYPLIAVAEELRNLKEEQKVREMELYFFSSTPYDEDELHRLAIKFRHIYAGKLRVYFSLWNLRDAFMMVLGIFQALWKIFVVYPDAVFTKGGYAAFPVVVAAGVLRIPMIMHESDTVSGRVNRITARLATYIYTAFEETEQQFPSKEVYAVGLPIREKIKHPQTEGAREYLHLKDDKPVLVVLCGSQGAEKINDLIVAILPDLVKDFYIIHQTGINNFTAVQRAANFVLSDSSDAERYKPFDFLDSRGIQMSAGLADLIISRSGSSLFEIAAWGVPSILIPLPHSHGQHQLYNAMAYQKSGACLVIEEDNLTPSVFKRELEELMKDRARLQEMSKAALEFHRDDAARKIAETLVKIGEEHEE